MLLRTSDRFKPLRNGEVPLATAPDVEATAELRVPAAVHVLDLDRPIESLTLTLPDGQPCRTAILLVRHHGRPLGTRLVALDESGCASTEEVLSACASLRAGAKCGAAEPPPSDDAHAARQPISVVIATCGTRPATLVRCVDSVLACGYDAVEVIVVDNRPDSPVAKAVIGEHYAEEPRVRYAPEPRRGLSHVRNRGLELAKGELVAFTDDDVVVDGGWLHAIAGAFTSDVSCVTGLIMPLAIGTPTQALFERFAGFNKGFERRSFALAHNADDPLFPYAAGTVGSGANTAVRKSVALRLGGFDVKLGAGTASCGGEDLDLYVRLLLAGETIVYEPAAVILHEHPADPEGLRRRVFGYGIGLGAMLTKQLVSGPRLPLLRAAPRGVRYALDPTSTKNAARGGDYPGKLVRRERLGMLAGPVAYLRSARASAVRSEPTGAPEDAFAPSSAGAVDLDQQLADIELGCTAAGQEYASHFALVRLHGDPITVVEVPAERGLVSSDALADAVWSGAGALLREHALAHGCLDPATVTRETISTGLPPLGRCPDRQIDGGDAPFVSVIVPTVRRPERIETCLASLAQLRYPRFEIIIVDNAPDDPRTRAVVEACSRADGRIRYVAEPLPGSSVARNRGVREAAGELLAFTDDDVMVDPQWLAWMVEPFLRDPRVGVVTGLVLPMRFDTPDQRWFEEISGFGKGFDSRLFDRDAHRADERLLYPYWGGVFGSGNSMAFRPSLLRQLGGFDPALGAGSRALAGADVESFTHAIIAGSRLAYEARAVCWHDHRADAAAVDKQMFNYGVGLTAILTKWMLRDPRLIGTMVKQVGRFLVSRVAPGAPGAGVPHELSRLGKQLHMNRQRAVLGLQVRGYCLGPLLYLYSVAWARRLRLHDVLPPGDLE